MGKQWTESENLPFLFVLDSYRDDIKGKNKQLVIEVTRGYAEKLYKENQILNLRTIQAIVEHLSYFDDLTAGVGTKKDFAIKDERYFGKNLRSDNSIKPNPARVFRSKEKYLK
ncbi:hypothetical protein P4361_21895 [Fictibacillus sp. B-59209]|uniref:hypothetical protein n=1 Tax=Fictibacillus sp. B-59209 TaxID=3024873 RepID=UPI002E2365CD|nr:hypothetical protein [Fictibacillus sp. B-59209]